MMAWCCCKLLLLLLLLLLFLGVITNHQRPMCRRQQLQLLL
jgi:hypothetical protein